MNRSGLRWDHNRWCREHWLSGGTTLKVPKTPAERLALYVKLRKLKTDFLRRRDEAANDNRD